MASHCLELLSVETRSKSNVKQCGIPHNEDPTTESFIVYMHLRTLARKVPQSLPSCKYLACLVGSIMFFVLEQSMRSGPTTTKRTTAKHMNQRREKHVGVFVACVFSHIPKFSGTKNFLQFASRSIQKRSKLGHAAPECMPMSQG